MRKETASSFKLTGLYCLLGSLGFLASCGEIEQNIVKKFPNSQGSHRLIITQSPTDATSDFLFNLRIASNGAINLEDDYQLVMQSNSIENLNVSWHGDRVVELNCMTGRIYFFKSELTIEGDQFRVELNTKCLEE